MTTSTGRVITAKCAHCQEHFKSVYHPQATEIVHVKHLVGPMHRFHVSCRPVGNFNVDSSCSLCNQLIIHVDRKFTGEASAPPAPQETSKVATPTNPPKWAAPIVKLLNYINAPKQ